MSDDDGAMKGGDDPTVLELARAFIRARFHVELGDRLHTLHVGTLQPALDALLEGTSYGYVTAWNPAAQARETAENMTDDDRLAARVAALGYGMRRTWSEDAQGAHREAGWLVIDADASRVDALGREFGQAGVLAWMRGEPVRLHMLMRPPPDSTGLPWVDWIE